MTDEKFEYRSNVKSINKDRRNTEFCDTDRLKCVWNCGVTKLCNSKNDGVIRFSWKFNWDELKKKGIDRLTGYIYVQPSYEAYYCNDFKEQKIKVDLKEPNQLVEKYININPVHPEYRVMFDYVLIPHYIQIEEVKKKILPSKQNNAVSVVEVDKNDDNEENLLSWLEKMLLSYEKIDAILVIDGKKIPVNKSSLSCNSEYFRNLFSLNDKDGKVNDFPIEGISIDDYNLLLRPISTHFIVPFPTDEIVEKMLELADRFMMSSVVAHCEHHLLHHSEIENEKMMWMGEKYGMSALLEKSILKMDTIEKVKKWKLTPEYINISNDTKGRVLDRLI